MKIKLDENLPARLKSVLSACGHETDTVNDEGLTGQSDQNVWRAAQADERFLITQDLDFSDTRKFIPGTHCGILLVRLREPSAQALLEQVTVVAAEIEKWGGCVVVLTEHKLRIKHPSDLN
jgi:predicted nuclease of predicted toxin-antitoxin system